MFVILPFEKNWYQQHDYQVTYVGHPLLDEISNKVKNSLFYKVNNLSAEPIIGVLPGSRKQEIAVKLPVMLSMAKYYPKFQFVVACAPGIEKSYYEQFVREQNVFRSCIIVRNKFNYFIYLIKLTIYYKTAKPQL